MQCGKNYASKYSNYLHKCNEQNISTELKRERKQNMEKLSSACIKEFASLKMKIHSFYQIMEN